MSETERFLHGQHAVVTGGSRGIGLAIAGELARRGARVTLMARSTEALTRHAAALAAEHAVAVTPVACDVTDAASVQAAFARAREAGGEVQLLVNGAGASASAPFGGTSRETWDQMLAVNLTSIFSCTQAVLPAMLAARGGRIVNVASTAALRGYKMTAAYCAAKHGVLGLTRALALETAKHGVTVNAVCPGYTETDMFAAATRNLVDALGRTPEEARALLVRTIPRGQVTTPREVADAVAWLCSPGASAVTGIALPVAGGEVA